MRRLVWAGAALVLMAGAAAGYAVVYRPPPGAPVGVEIPPGRSTDGIARQLDSEGVIGSVLGFRVAARLRGLDGSLRAGRYQLRRGMGVQAALDAMERGPRQRSVAVTIPEGYTVRRIAQKIAARTHVGERDFLAATESGTTRARIQPTDVRSLEGFVFPETYAVNDKETAPALLERMVRTFEERTAPLDWSVPEKRGLSRYQAVVVASLVEREAKVPEDRAKVAAVIYNRLDKRMRLEIDATVLYDLPAHKVPTKLDLRRPSPYNTYLHAGLPPTPIANPGIEAIRAALAPAPVDALYYVVIDPSGRHGFTSSFEEFERLKRLRPAETRGGR